MADGNDPMRERAAKGGGDYGPGRARSLDPDSIRISFGQQPSSQGIQRGTPADWFGPLDPLTPTAPGEVAGRILDYPSGYNLVQQPRAYEISFQMLRNLADSYDLLRTVIETRKDQLARLRWNIAPRDPKTKFEGDLKGRAQTIEKFFQRPDRVHFWDAWLRMLLEDLLVIDAPAVYLRRTRAGDLYGLEVIDGALVKRVIDDWGRTPEPPLAAYQQVLKGFPAVNYTTRDLLYRPRNIRAHKIYGYSPVEQILMTVSIALRRQVFQLNYFTEGNIPEALIGTPENWTPDQIRQFQVWFDSMLEGNLAARRRMHFVPGGAAKAFIQLKQEELFGMAEEWIARVVCFAFSVSPQPFIKMMNRATAQVAQETAVEEGLAPLQDWIKNLIDTVIVDEFGENELEFQWVNEDELDPKTKSEIVRAESESGLMTMNQARAKMGLDPYPYPEADRPMMKTATGWVPVFLTEEEKAAKEATALAISGGKVGPDGKPLKPGEDGEEVEEEGETAPPKPPGNAPPTDASQIGKLHDDSIHPVERVPMRVRPEDAVPVTFGEYAGDDVVNSVLNTAAKKFPDWR